jgi:hypothetical protein
MDTNGIPNCCILVLLSDRNVRRRGRRGAADAVTAKVERGSLMFCCLLHIWEVCKPVKKPTISHMRSSFCSTSFTLALALALATAPALVTFLCMFILLENCDIAQSHSLFVSLFWDNSDGQADTLHSVTQSLSHSVNQSITRCLCILEELSFSTVILLSNLLHSLTCSYCEAHTCIPHSYLFTVFVQVQATKVVEGKLRNQIGGTGRRGVREGSYTNT